MTERDDRLRAQCDVDVFTAGGPGGQHRNKTATAVRLRHRPSGIVVTARERRSQAQNFAAAFERLRERLAARVPPKPRVATRSPPRAARTRLDDKRRRGERKRTRRAPGDE